MFATARSTLASTSVRPLASSKAWQELNRQAVRTASSTSNGISSKHVGPTNRLPQYLVIRSFFRRHAVQQSQEFQRYNQLKAPSSTNPHHRVFSTATIARRHSDPEEDSSLSERRAVQQQQQQRQQKESDTSQPWHSDYPFHNYPRSLRELAIRAREQGTREAEEELQAAIAERDELASQKGGLKSESQDGESAERNSSKDVDIASEQASSDPISRLSTPLMMRRWPRARPPSKEDLLQIAQGFWTRLRIRFKWFTIRGFRRFNADDISAFFTLGGLGTIVFIIVGTTTAVSLVFAALNVLNMQEWIARKIADYLTAETGVTVIFENAIVPKWKDSRICFQNVFISRRAYGNDADTLRRERSRHAAPGKRPKRMTAATAGQGMAWEGTHFNEFDEDEVSPPMSERALGQVTEEEDDGRRTNFSMFDLNVDSIDVKLSFRRWWDGKGLVEDAVIEGVRGIIDRRNVHWDPDKAYDPRQARREPKHGDFELDAFSIQDLLVTVYQPGDFRPFNLSIFEAQVPRLRKQWLFYDLLGADRITGQVDGCLFSLHKPQSIGRTSGREREIETGRWKTLSRLRIDGINFDHIQNQSDVHGPVSWILSGKFDVVADIKFPKEASSDIDINLILSEIFEHLSQAVSTNENPPDAPIPGQHRLSGPAIEAPVTTVGPAAEGAWRQREKELELLKAKGSQGWRNEMELAAREASKNRSNTGAASKPLTVAEEDEKSSSDIKDADNENQRANEEELASSAKSLEQQEKGKKEAQASEEAARKLPLHSASVVIDLDVRFKDIKAAVPLFSSDLTYRTQTFVRPIVAFMNANHTLIPVHCRVVMDLSEFDGAMDLSQTGLLPIISEKIYEALAHHVQSQGANNRRIRSVSQWWLRLASDQLLQYAQLVRDTMIRSRTRMTTGDPSHLSLQQDASSVA